MTTVDEYAQALFDVAKRQGALDTVEEELFRVARTLEASDDLHWTLSDQSVPVEVRQATLQQLLDAKVSPLTATLAAFVVGEGAARELPDIIDRLVAKVADERNQYVAEVHVAEPLDEGRLERLRTGLARTLGREVEVRQVVDPTVLGGIVARVGDTVIDGTIGHRLDQLRRSLRATPGTPGAAAPTPTP
ncbi:MAG TPA: ATP synthase F1 subunit delta [Acidimicrobiales bacterium]|nr:ATP synthase F1 subunit delta [Acidimicrobiales bacterium]